MEREQLAQLPKMKWVTNRIHAIDALATFVKEEDKDNPDLQALVWSYHQFRSYPEEGGQKVLVPYEGGDYDAAVFHVEKDAWDHEHCDVCNVNIAPMTLVLVSLEEPHLILCQRCHRRFVRRLPRWLW